MQDPRIDKLAAQLVRYSTGIKKNDRVLIDVYDVPDEVPIALIRAVRAAKAEPFVNINNARVTRELYMGATEAQYDVQSKLALAQMQKLPSVLQPVVRIRKEELA